MPDPKFSFDPGQVRILVIDDHDQIRKAIKRTLQALPFQNIQEASDGAKGIAAFKNFHPTLVICDLSMPVMDGFTVLETIRQLALGADIPVLVVTGEGSKEDIIKSIELGASDYLLKPFHAADLEKKVVKLLESHLQPEPLLKLLRTTEALLLRGQVSDARPHLTEAQRLDPNSIRGQFLEAFILTQEEKPREAEALLRKLLITQPHFYRASALLADILLDSGRKNEAVQCMEDELKFNSKQPRRLIQLGRLKMEQGLLAESTNLFRKALIIDPRDKEALLAMGHSQVKLGRIDKGIYYFKRVRRNFPDSREALEAIVMTCERINDLRQAEFVLKDERAEHPDNPDSSILLARVYFMQEKLEDAIQVAQELTHSGQSEEAALILALAEIKNQNFGKALRALEAITEGPNLPYAYRLQAELHLANNDFPKSEQCAQKAFAAEPWNELAIILQAKALHGSESPLKSYYAACRALALGADKAVLTEMIEETRACVDRKRDKIHKGNATNRAS